MEHLTKEYENKHNELMRYCDAFLHPDALYRVDVLMNQAPLIAIAIIKKEQQGSYKIFEELLAEAVKGSEKIKKYYIDWKSNAKSEGFAEYLFNKSTGVDAIISPDNSFIIGLSCLLAQDEILSKYYDAYKKFRQMDSTLKKILTEGTQKRIELTKELSGGLTVEMARKQFLNIKAEIYKTSERLEDIKVKISKTSERLEALSGRHNIENTETINEFINLFEAEKSKLLKEREKIEAEKSELLKEREKIEKKFNCLKSCEDLQEFKSQTESLKKAVADYNAYAKNKSNCFSEDQSK